MFSGRSSVRASVRDSRGSFMFPRYLQYLLTDFRQFFVTGAPRDRDDLITFLVQKVKVQGHAIPAEAHSTRRYRRVQLFLVLILFLSALCSIHTHTNRNSLLWRLLYAGDLMNFSNVVATVPAILAPSIVGAFTYEYVSANRQYLL